MGSTVIPSTVEARRMIPQLEFKKDLHHDMGRVFNKNSRANCVASHADMRL